MRRRHNWQHLAIDYDPSGTLAFSSIDPGRRSVKRAFIAAPISALSRSERESRNHTVRSVKNVLLDYDYFNGRFEIYDPEEHSPRRSTRSSEVYRRNRIAILESDLFVLTVTEPAIGIGVELQLAADATLPVLLIVKHGVPLSPLCKGSAARINWRVFFSDLGKLRYQLNRHMIRIWTHLDKTSSLRKEAVSAIHEAASMKINPLFFANRVRLKIPIADLARRADIDEQHLRVAETDNRMMASLGLLALSRISNILEIGPLRLGTLDPVLSTRTPLPPLMPHHSDSLENLRKAALRMDVPESTIFEKWEQYYRDSLLSEEEALLSRGTEVPITVADWQQRLRKATSH